MFYFFAWVRISSPEVLWVKIKTTGEDGRSWLKNMVFQVRGLELSGLAGHGFQDGSLSSWVSSLVTAKEGLTPLLAAPLLLFLLGAQSRCEKATSSTLLPSLVLIIPMYTIILLLSESLCSLKPLPVRILSSTDTDGEVVLTPGQSPVVLRKVARPSKEGWLFQKGPQLRGCSALKRNVGWRPLPVFGDSALWSDKSSFWGFLRPQIRTGEEGKIQTCEPTCFCLGNSHTSIPGAGRPLASSRVVSLPLLL